MKCKHYTFLLSGLLVCGLLFSCKSSQPAGKTAEREVNYSAMSTLADALRVQSGLQVVGSANNVKVTVRGVNSSRTTKSNTYVQGVTSPGPSKKQTTVMTDVEPLFVIDNTIVGNTYADAARGVNVQDIVSIKILKSYSETNAYGESGKNGVILINTKLNSVSSNQ